MHIHNFASSRSLVGPHGLMRINNLTSTRSHVGPRGRILNPTSQKCRFVEMKKATSIRATQNQIMSQQKNMEKGTRHRVFPFLFGCCEDCTQEDERIVTSDTVSKYKDGDARSSHWLRLQPHLIIRKKRGGQVDGGCRFKLMYTVSDMSIDHVASSGTPEQLCVLAVPCRSSRALAHKQPTSSRSLVGPRGPSRHSLYS